MDIETQGRLRAFAEWYVTLVEAMRTGQYADDANGALAHALQ